MLSPQTQESSEEGVQHGLGEYAIFLKYVRLGTVKLKVSTSGYKLVRLNEFEVRTTGSCYVGCTLTYYIPLTRPMQQQRG